MSGESRQCPLCDAPTNESICPVHAVPTLEPGIFDRPPEPVDVGKEIAGRYRIERVLAKGAMGSVFVARSIGVQRVVAIKVLHAEKLNDPIALKRFYREAMAASSLNHPNIVQLFDFGIEPKLRVPFIAMELVEGKTLAKLLAEDGPLDEQRAAHLLVQVAKALAEAHAVGIVHRDLKTDNVMVVRLRTGEEHVKVVDFGIAKRVRSDAITASGMAVGSPHYMSPEQALAEDVDVRTDLYALGILLFELLTGDVPYDAPRPIDVMKLHVMAPVPQLPLTLKKGGSPSDAMRVLINALLAKRREDRPQRATLAVRILEAIARRTPIDARQVLGDRSEMTGPSTPTTSPGIRDQEEAESERERADRRKIVNEETRIPSPTEPDPMAGPTIDPMSEPVTASMMPTQASTHAVQVLTLPPDASSLDAPTDTDMKTEIKTEPSADTPPFFGDRTERSSEPPVMTDPKIIGVQEISATTPQRSSASVVLVAPITSIAPQPPQNRTLLLVAMAVVTVAVGALAITIFLPPSGIGEEHARTPPSEPAKRIEAQAVARSISSPAKTATVAQVAQQTPPPPVHRTKKTPREKTPPPASTHATVTIRSEPPGAQVVIGGRVIGTTPVAIPVDAEHRVTIRKAGFVDRTVTLPRDAKTDLSFRLAPEW